MSGFGISPFGVAPYGLGTPSTSSSNAGSPLTDANGNHQGSRYIDSRTRRYTYDANGRAIGMSNVAQLVYLAFLTIVRTSSMPSLGIGSLGGVIGNGFNAKREQAVRQALGSLVDKKIIEIVSIEINSKVRPVFTRVRWRDLTAMVEQETVI